MDGILNINKEKGYTSHDVVARVRRIAGQKKVGHTGTLDPEATGVLPVCLGAATKLCDYIMAERKTYLAEATFGVTTTTEDGTGEALLTRPVAFDPEQIKQAVQSFVGEISQVPPMYSAIKVQGKKLYELAREGKEIARAPRKVQIFEIGITEYLPPDRIKFLVCCSKGTYIRTLCADIGEALGCGAHMSALCRVKSGRFTIENSISLSKLMELSEVGRLSEAVIPMEEALAGYGRVFVSQKAEKSLFNGMKIGAAQFVKTDGGVSVGQVVLGYHEDGRLIGIYQMLADESQKSYMKPLRLL